MTIRTIGCKAFKVTIPTPSEAVPLAELSFSERHTTEFEVYSMPTNQGPIYIGMSDVSADTHIPRFVNSTTAFSAEDVQGEPKHYDLATYFVVGTAADEVIVQYRTIVN